MKSWMRRGMIGFGLAATVAVGAYVVSYVAAHRALEKAYTSLEQSGRPSTLDDLIPTPIADADNAALIYLQVFNRLESESVEGEDLFSVLDALSENLLSEEPSGASIESFTHLIKGDRVSESLATLADVSTKQGCQFTKDYTQGFAIPVDHVHRLFKLSRILGAKALIETQENNLSDARTTLVMQFELANSLAEEPLLISQLTRLVLMNRAIESAQNLNVFASASNEELETFENLLIQFEDPKPLLSAMDGERLIAETVFDLSETDFAEMLEGPHPPIYPAPFLKYDRSVYLSLMNSMIEKQTAPYSLEDGGFGQRLVKQIPPYCILTNILLPHIARLKEKQLTSITQARITRIGIQVLRHQKRTGTFPENLHVLQVDTVHDPFSGESLIYQADEDQFVIYSPGENLLDEGALPGENGNGDIAWQVTLNSTHES